MPILSFKAEQWPIAGSFTISRGAKTAADIVVAEISDGSLRGRGECVPYARYGETIAGVLALLENLKVPIAQGLDRAQLQTYLPAGAARNALDCAFWDLEAKRSRKTIWDLTGRSSFSQITTAFTLSLGDPQAMADAARKIRAPLLKLKLAGDEQDLARVQAVHRAAPNVRLILDANEGFTPPSFENFLAQLTDLNVALIEQPLNAQDDEALLHLQRSIPIAADESCHTRADLARLQGRYDAINIKLDKTGGLTEALALEEDARKFGFSIMVGCMVATSLAMAPALVLAGHAEFVDLDGPLLLAADRAPGLHYDGTQINAFAPDLWG